MYFNSIEYFLFLPLVYVVFYFAKDKYRWLVLLSASYIFYASLKSAYLLLVLAGASLVTFYFGLKIFQEKNEKNKKRYLWVGIGINVAILVAMKYIPFISDNIEVILKALFNRSPAFAAPVIVSIGVAFYVIQAIAYLNDVYLEIQEPERHCGYFALYMSFFPKLLQGPIERGNQLLPQLKKPYEFNYENMRSGLLLFTWGLFKKVVIADRLALFVNEIYGAPSSYAGWPLALATYVYAVQIYADFSGYTDMALGAARLFNIQLTDNFNRPYMASSVAEFWRRWHISFSRWLLDYIFKPLQMKWRDQKVLGSILALLVTFLISGVWHGAKWTFVIWGLLHGTYLALEVCFKSLKKKRLKSLRPATVKLINAWNIFVTFNLVCLAWIFFRSDSLGQAMKIVSCLFTMHHHQRKGITHILDPIDTTIVVFSLTALISVHLLQLDKREISLKIFRFPLPLR
ncbi:MAG: MBOAT family protein, partial [Candidatus Sumerlaeota bacterium]|nr:MBOAT family protein [Candidatus Sumerlaeota bacterium]